MKAHWEVFWATQTIKRELHSVSRVEPGAEVLSRIQAQVGEIQPRAIVPNRSRLVGRMVAIAAVVPLLIVVASAATLFPQTADGAQQWMEKRWSEQTTAGMHSGATSGISGSPMGVTGFDAKEQVTWSMHGIARIKIHIKGGSYCDGTTIPFTKDLEMRIARLLSPAISTAVREFQEAHQSNPETTVIVHGQSQQWNGFGHFEFKDKAGDTVLTADVTPAN